MSSDFICKKENFRSHSKFSRLNSFQDFRIAKFSPDSIMNDGMELAFNQADQPLYVSWCWRCWLLNSSDMTLIKIYSSLKQNHLLSMKSFFYLILTIGLGSFIKIIGGVGLLTNALGGSSLKFELEAKARA